MAQIEVVVGGNYGSEGKGHVSAQRVLDGLAHGRPVYNLRVGGPNAGHTAVTSKTEEAVAFRHVPVGALYEGHVTPMICAGSEVDLNVLLEELKTLHVVRRENIQHEGTLEPKRVWLDKNATVLEPEHIKAEEASDLNRRTGSTAKGVGAARADRIWRKALTVSEAADTERYQHLFNELENHGLRVTDTAAILQQLLAGTSNARVVIEGTQGYELGLHSDSYPQVTSNDCRAVDFLSQAGISPWTSDSEVTVWVVARVYPIRVAGNSGKMAGSETSWEQLGLPVEKTTVTKKERRVATFNAQQLEGALIGNGADFYQRNPQVKLVLTMVDQVAPSAKGLEGHLNLDELEKHSEELTDWLKLHLGEVATSHLSAVTTAPDKILYLEEETVPQPWGKEDPEPEEQKPAVSLKAGSLAMGTRVLFDLTSVTKLKSEEELLKWWLISSFEEAKAFVKKDTEYGQGSLVELGSILHQAGVGGGTNELLDLETAVWVYVNGKLARWNSAVSRGKPVSDDTLLDLVTYVKMVQRHRSERNK